MISGSNRYDHVAGGRVGQRDDVAVNRFSVHKQALFLAAANRDLVERSAERAADLAPFHRVGQAGGDLQSVVIGLYAEDALADRNERPCRSTREPRVLRFPIGLGSASRDGLAVTIRLSAMDLALVLDVRGSVPRAEIERAVAVFDRAIRQRNPGIVVAEHRTVFLISGRIRGDLAEVIVV